MLFLASALLVVFSSCNTDYHFMSTPFLDEDFDLPSDEMRRIFWDVNRYEERTFPFTAFFEMPPLNELQWGNRFYAPKEKSWSAWNLCPFFLLPPLCPCKDMVWERGNYRFKAVVAYPILYGFLPHLWYWDVEEIQPGLNG